MISTGAMNDADHILCDTVSESALVTLLVLDDDYTAKQSITRVFRHHEGVQPQRVIWLSFCKAFEYFNQTARVRQLSYNTEVLDVDTLYTLVLLDIRADKGRLIWDLEKQECVVAETNIEDYGLSVFNYAVLRNYDKDKIWIYSGHDETRKTTYKAIGAEVKIFEKEKGEFFDSLKARVRDWAINLNRVSHSQWRKLEFTTSSEENDTKRV